MSQTAIEALRTAVHNAMIETVRMEDDSVQAWQNAVDTITTAALSALHAKAGVSVEGLETIGYVQEEAQSNLSRYGETFIRQDPYIHLGYTVALITRQSAEDAISALSTKLQEPVGWQMRVRNADCSGQICEWIHIAPTEYGRNPEMWDYRYLYAAPTLAHQPVTAGWAPKRDDIEKACRKAMRKVNLFETADEDIITMTIVVDFVEQALAALKSGAA